MMAQWRSPSNQKGAPHLRPPHCGAGVHYVPVTHGMGFDGQHYLLEMRSRAKDTYPMS